nr:rod shape-determining protein MreC [Sharpea porci]
MVPLYNNDKKKRSRKMIAVTIILVVVSVFSLLANADIPGAYIVKDSMANIEYYIIKAPISYVRSVFQEYVDLKVVYRENKRLKKSLDGYAGELAMNNVLTNELEEMKKLTGIKNLSTDYELKYTNIIERDANNWSNEVTINIGSNSDVTNGMAVITSKGMIGTVTKVTPVSSTVTLLTDENAKSQLPVMITDGSATYYGLLNSYNIKSKTFNVSILSTVDKIAKGASVTTSGLGGKGKSPKGLLVGTVTSFSSGDNATGKTVTVKPAANFDDLNYVAVVKRTDS